METIIKWLMEIELLASDIYSRTAGHFKDDPELSDFLNHIAEDEAWHYHIMASASEHYRNRPYHVPAIAIDKSTNKKIQAPFRELSDKLSSGNLTKNFLLEKIIATEFSEWNDIFLYVVNTLKRDTRVFIYPATRIQHHKRSIEYFFESLPSGLDRIKSLQYLPPVWNEKILIVEDDENIGELIKAILNKEGDIDIATNGVEGLEKIRKEYYKLIISDIDMPQMDGLTFFQHASVIFPKIDERFLFFTGDLSTERMKLLTDNKLRFLKKPSSIATIRDHALQILLQLKN